MNKRDKKQQKIKEKVTRVIGDKYSKNDPMGSYTGKPCDPGTIPVQDADDL